MINGPAVGSGMDMALHCDIRVGCENTRFIGYQQLGQIIENGGSYYLPRMAGLGRALEFAYTGHLDAQRAYDWGLLNYLVSSDELEQTTRDLCVRIMRTRPWFSGSASASCAPPWTPTSRTRWSSHPTQAAFSTARTMPRKPAVPSSRSAHRNSGAGSRPTFPAETTLPALFSITRARECYVSRRHPAAIVASG